MLSDKMSGVYGDVFDIFLTEASTDKHISRAIFVDFELNVVDEVRAEIC